MKGLQDKSMRAGGPYPGLQFTSTKSEEDLNPGLRRPDPPSPSPRTRRKKSKKSDRNLLVYLFAISLVSVIMFLFSFKLVHDSRPVTSEYIRPMKTIRKNQKEIIPLSVEQKHKKDSKSSSRGKQSNKVDKKNLIEKKSNQEVTKYHKSPHSD